MILGRKSVIIAVYSLFYMVSFSFWGHNYYELLSHNIIFEKEEMVNYRDVKLFKP